MSAGAHLGPEEERPREEPLWRIAAHRAVRAARRTASPPGFARLLVIQATGGAGDALVALALAGSLFFSVPEAAARDRVVLYLALTMAPFAVVAPFLSLVLDRFRGSLRFAALTASGGRFLLAWLLATRLDSFYLFPIAFGVLVLSRAALVVKGALLPQVVGSGSSLVEANSSISKTMALAGIVAGAPGLLLVMWPGPGTELLFAASIYGLGMLPALRLPSGKGRRTVSETRAARKALGVSIRHAAVAAAGMRLVVGFLVFHLAFALRRADFGSLDLGFMIGCAAFGSLAGAVLAPRVRRRLKEEGIVAAGLFVAGVAGIVAGAFFSLWSAGALAFAFGLTQGAVKLSFDAIVQRDVPEAARGWAFARFESVMQLAWVAGALLPVAVAIPAGAGVTGAGVAASVLALVYVAGRRQARSSRTGWLP